MAQLLGQLVAATAATVLRVFLRVGCFRRCQQLCDLLFQPLLFLFHARQAHRLVLRGVCFELRSVERHDSQFQKPHALTQLEQRMQV